MRSKESPLNKDFFTFSLHLMLIWIITREASKKQIDLGIKVSESGPSIVTHRPATVCLMSRVATALTTL